MRSDYFRIKYATKFLKEKGYKDARMVVVEWLYHNENGKLVPYEYSSHMQVRDEKGKYFVQGGYFKKEKDALEDCKYRMKERPWVWEGILLKKQIKPQVRKME